MTSNKIRSIDMLRSLSLLMIIVYHFFSYIRHNGYISEFSSILQYFGDAGVSFFIMISGGGIYLNNNLKASWLIFYKKRFLGIYPQYWTCYILISFTMYLLYGSLTVGNNPWLIILTLTGLDGFFSSQLKTYYLTGEWFLGMIIIIYLLYPLILKAYKYNKYIFIIIAFIASILLYIASDSIADNTILWNKYPIRNPIIRIAEFAFGMLLFDTIKHGKLNLRYVLPGSFLVVVIYFLTGIKYSNLVYIPFYMACFTIMVSIYEYRINSHILDRLFSFLSSISFLAFLVHHQLIYQVLKNKSFNSMTESGFIYLGLIIIFICLSISIIIKPISDAIKKVLD